MKVLIVDDQEAVRTALSLLLELNGMQCLTAQSPEQALDLIRTEDVGVVIQDMNFTKDTTSGEEGAQLFADIMHLIGLRIDSAPLSLRSSSYASSHSLGG